MFFAMVWLDILGWLPSGGQAGYGRSSARHVGEISFILLLTLLFCAPSVIMIVISANNFMSMHKCANIASAEAYLAEKNSIKTI
jgi:hypothetical protein